MFSFSLVQDVKGDNFMDFINSFFSWGEKPKEEIKEIKIINGRDRVSKRFRKPKPKVEKIKLPREEREEEDE